MKKNIKIIGIIIVVMIVMAAFYGYNEYMRKPADLGSVTPQASITSDSLVKIFEADENKANQLYLGKAIDIAGVISGINKSDTLVNVLFGKPDDMHRVSCLVDTKHTKDLATYKAGDSIVLRGICTGYLIDVELNRCVVIR